MRYRNEGSSGVVGGISFTGLLTIAFIVLKLLKVINWSWWWVLSPLWIEIGLALLVLFSALIFMAIAHSVEINKKKKIKELFKDYDD
jgi:membrane protein YdbS with pleckstrin-like domain